METGKAGSAQRAAGTEAGAKNKSVTTVKAHKGYVTAHSGDDVAGLKKMGPNAVVAFSVGGEIRFVKASSADKYEKSLKSQGTGYARLNADQFKAITWGGDKASAGRGVHESKGTRGGSGAKAAPQDVAKSRGPGKATAQAKPETAEPRSTPPSSTLTREHKVRSPLKSPSSIVPSGERVAKH